MQRQPKAEVDDADIGGQTGSGSCPAPAKHLP